MRKTLITAGLIWIMASGVANGQTITETCAALWPSDELQKELCISNEYIASWEKHLPRAKDALGKLGDATPDANAYLYAAVSALEGALPELKSSTQAATSSTRVVQLRNAFNRAHRPSFIITQTNSLAGAETLWKRMWRYDAAKLAIKKQRDALANQGINVTTIDAIITKITSMYDGLYGPLKANRYDIAALRKSTVAAEHVAANASLKQYNALRAEHTKKMATELRPLFLDARSELARLVIPPTAPVISDVTGPSATTVGTSETWTIVASDANADVLSFKVSYSDGTENPVTTAGTFSRSFGAIGTYTMTVTATDPGGLQSNVFTKSIQVSPARPVSHKVKMWLTPTFASIDFYKFPSIAPNEGDLLKHVDTFKFYSGRFPVNRNNTNPNLYTLEELKQFADLFNSRGIQASFETGLGVLYCDKYPTLIGEKSAERDMKRFAIWMEQGGKVHSITFDGPEHRLLVNSACVGKGFTVADVARETADYFVAMKKYFEELNLPVPQFDLISNFPNWPYDGEPPSNWGSYLTTDYKLILDSIVNESRARGVTFNSLQLDNPYFYGGFGRVKKVSAQARNLGLKVGMIFNSGGTQLITAGTSNCEHNVNFECRGPIKPKTSYDEAQETKYAKETLAAIELWKKEVGGSPDYAVIQSWYAHPYSIFPITQQNSMSHLFMESEKLLNH